MFGWFTALGALAKLATVVGTLAIVGSAYGYWHYSVRSAGYASCVADVKEANTEAINEALAARNRRRDCAARDGMRWDQTTGQCIRGDL